MYPSEWSKKYSKPNEWCKVKNFTVRNYAFVFTHSRYNVSDISREQITTVHTSDLWIHPSTIVRVSGDFENISFQLSRLAHGPKGALGCIPITTNEVKEKLEKAIENGAYRKEGQSLVSVWWCVDNFLKREKPTEKSEWIVLATPHLEFETSSEEFMHRHIRSILEPQIRDIEKKVERTIWERVKEKLHLE